MVKTSSLVFLQYLTSVFDNIDDAILLIGVEPKGEYRLLLANGAFWRNSGHDQASCIGKSISVVVTPDSYTFLKKIYKKVVDTKKPLTSTAWFDVPLGRQAFDIKLIPVLNTVGDCVQIAAITRNVTELSNLRHEVQELKTARHAVTRVA